MKALKAYDVILRPVITEKSTMASEHNQVQFRVPLTATKPKIKEAVEALFDVKVKDVNTLRMKGKQKRLRNGLRVFRSDWKKAIVTLEEGYSIDVTTGL
jgi:large subunit ribosomal protein L23